MSWRNISRNIVTPSHKHNSYKNFGSYKRKDRNSSKLDTILRKGVYGGSYGFIQKTRCLAKDEQYKNFNVKSTKMTMGQTRCGVIAFNHDLTKIVCICNKCIYDQYGIKQWGLPKGHMEKDDRVYSNCASREFFEETGVRYNIIQNKCVYKRVNNTIYYPIVIDESKNLRQLDKTEVLEVEWKNIRELLKEGVCTKYHNQDLKVFLHRYLHETKKLAQKNNEVFLKNRT